MAGDRSIYLKCWVPSGDEQGALEEVLRGSSTSTACEGLTDVTSPRRAVSSLSCEIGAR